MAPPTKIAITEVRYRRSGPLVMSVHRDVFWGTDFRSIGVATRLQAATSNPPARLRYAGRPGNYS